MNKIKFLILTVLILGFTTALFAQREIDATVTANVVDPIVIEKIADLKFGNIIASATAGTVKISTSGIRSNTAGTSFPSMGGAVGAAEFVVTGYTNATYEINIPQDNVVTLINGSSTMKLKTFTHNATKVLTGGAETFKVGATLVVGANQPAGYYTASFQVTVYYN